MMNWMRAVDPADPQGGEWVKSQLSGFPAFPLVTVSGLRLKTRTRLTADGLAK